jgi:hypothetical protein
MLLISLMDNLSTVDYTLIWYDLTDPGEDVDDSRLMEPLG